MGLILFIFYRFIQQRQRHTAILCFKYVFAQPVVDKVYNEAEQDGKQEYRKRNKLKIAHAFSCNPL